MKNKPDDRRDNAKKIQYNIDKTIYKMEVAEEMIAKTDNPNTKRRLSEKNERRREALDGLRSEMKDEVEHQQNKG